MKPSLFVSALSLAVGATCYAVEPSCGIELAPSGSSAVPGRSSVGSPPAMSIEQYWRTNIRARDLARMAGVDLARANSIRVGSDEDKIDALNVLVARALNQRGITPISILQMSVNSRPDVMAFIGELEAEARSKKLTIRWHERDAWSTDRSEQSVNIAIDIILGADAISYGLYAIKHELTHVLPADVHGGLSQTWSEYEDVHLRAFLLEELRVRLLDRTTYRRLTALGLPLPESQIGISFALWRAHDRGEDESSMIALFSSAYAPFYRAQLHAAYVYHFYAIWRVALNQVLQNPTTGGAEAFATLVTRVGLMHGLNTDERVAHLNTFRSEYLGDLPSWEYRIRSLVGTVIDRTIVRLTSAK